MMTIRSGFSIIELLVAIGVLGIVFVMTVPNYGAMQKDREYMAEVQAIFDLIAEARNNALVNKKCFDDDDVAPFTPTESERWEVFLSGDSQGLAKTRLICKPINSNVVPESDFYQAQLAKIENINLQAPLVFTELDDFVNNDQIRVGFVSGNAQGQVNFYKGGYAATNRHLVSQSLEYEFGMLDGEKKSSICMNTIGSFAEIDLYSHDCTDDL